MKYIFPILFFFYSTCLYPQNSKYTLSIKLTNIQSQKGYIEIGLYNDPGKFPKVGQTDRMIRLRPEGNSLLYLFKDLEPANYAVCVYHDENNNNSCDRNFFGIPKEAYAFMNNVRPFFKIPNFIECSINLNKDKLSNIKMIY